MFEESAHGPAVLAPLPQALPHKVSERTRVAIGQVFDLFLLLGHQVEKAALLLEHQIEVGRLTFGQLEGKTAERPDVDL